MSLNPKPSRIETAVLASMVPGVKYPINHFSAWKGHKWNLLERLIIKGYVIRTFNAESRCYQWEKIQQETEKGGGKS